MTRTYLKFRSRIILISSVMILFWFTLAVRLFQIQIIDGATYRQQGYQQAQTQIPLPAVRGNIFDRNNQPFTQNLVYYSIGVHPQKVKDPENLAQILSSGTGRPIELYLKRLASSKPFVYLERNLRKEECELLLSNAEPGVIIERHAKRYYPHENIGSQVIGFTDVDDRGVAGIEKRFDQYLKGQNGWVYRQRNGKGLTKPKNGFPIKPPIDGANIQLTIDLDYQTILQEELLRRLEETGAKTALGVLMDPQTGDLLAMASIPDFDPNRVSEYDLENQKNRTITDQFEPGSTFKIVVTTAALALNTVRVDQEFNCENGSYQFAGKIINDWDQFGVLTLPQIIENSSNVGIIKIAKTVGPGNLYRYCRDFGFGTPTNINLIGESSGTLHKTSEWSEISLAEVSLGHEVGVTALQLASAYAAVANGGFLMRPRIIKQIVAPDNKILYQEHPEVIRKVASREVMETLTSMLLRVVKTGTGEKANIPGWLIAGKTGTAQKYIDGEYSNKKFVSSFAGFFPADDPRIVGVFILDEPQVGYHWGGVGAAPLFKRVMERIINMDDSLQPNAKPISKPRNYLVQNAPEPTLRPSLATQMKVVNNPLQDQPAVYGSIVPDVRGMSLRKAKLTLRLAELKTRFTGSGTVYWQSPKPGTKVTPGSICTIGLK